jgi:H+/Cl- antiporter ClcA
MVKIKKNATNLIKKLSGLCAPAMFYLVLSIISFLAILFQNCQMSNVYIIGDYVTKLPCHNAWFFAGKIFYIFIFTWLLNFICKKGYTNISWFLVLLPFIGMFLLLSTIILFLMKAEQEGIGDYTSISRGWKGQIDGGITSGDIYLVEQEKEKDIITERNKLKKIIDKNEERKKKEQQKAEEKAIKKTNK